jgi:hypothetical protein
VITSKLRNLRSNGHIENKIPTQSKYCRKSNGPTIVWLKSKSGRRISNQITAHLLISGCSTDDRAFDLIKQPARGKTVCRVPIEGDHPYVYLDGIVLKRSWAGQVIGRFSAIACLPKRSRSQCRVDQGGIRDASGANRGPLLPEVPSPGRWSWAR